MRSLELVWQYQIGVKLWNSKVVLQVKVTKPVRCPGSVSGEVDTLQCNEVCYFYDPNKSCESYHNLLQVTKMWQNYWLTPLFPCCVSQYRKDLTTYRCPTYHFAHYCLNLWYLNYVSFWMHNLFEDCFFFLLDSFS